MTLLDELYADYRPGRSLARPFYTDPAIFEAEMDRIFRQSWLFAGHACRIPEPGEDFTTDAGGDSIIVIRTDDGDISALLHPHDLTGAKIAHGTSYELRADWLVRADAVEGVDYEVERVIAFTDRVNREDRDLILGQAAGVRSSRYAPGPLVMDQESCVQHFLDWYMAKMKSRPSALDHAIGASGGR